MKTGCLLALISLVAATACALPSPLRAPAAVPPTSAATPPPRSTTPAATPLPGAAPTVETCPPGKSPLFVLGFAGLKGRLGERMGEPLSCERPGPEGDSLQQTTTGLARYRKTTNIPSFTTGTEHWALTIRGLAHWTGRSLDPPEDAEIVDANSELVTEPTTTTVQAPATHATQIPYADAITLPPDADTEIIPGLPAWIQKPLLLLREYDRRNGTVLVPAIVRADISVGHLGGKDGAWGLFVPSSHRIVLDSSLASESPQAVAPVLGHEADHARDTFQYGPPRSDAACYTFEITAFALEARIWASLYGPAGKPDPSTDLEAELNLILQTSHRDGGRLIGAIKDNYQAECG